MSDAPNQNGSGLEQQFAGLDLQSRGSASERYVPPHLRNKQGGSSGGGSGSGGGGSSTSDRYEGGRDNLKGGRGGGGASGGGRNYNNRDRDGGRENRDNNRSGDFSSFNTRNRRDNYQNGDTFDRANCLLRTFGTSKNFRIFLAVFGGTFQMANINWYEKEFVDKGEKMSEDDHVLLLSLADVQLRFLCPNDLDEVRALCQDWFPIEYPSYWYEEITRHNSSFYSLAAIYKQEIVGLIVAEIKDCSILDDEDLGILSEWMEDSNVAYILSLGVVKKYRRNGIASLLLDSLLRNLTTPERKNVKAVFLHVLTTNAAAIKFYEQKKFRLHTFLPYYYSIKGKCKDGFMYVLYINGGHPPWTLYDYIKFMCGKVINGAGLFPWVLRRLNRVLHWVWREPSVNSQSD